MRRALSLRALLTVYMYSSLILGLTSVVTVSGARISLPPRTKENLLNKYDNKFQNTFYETKTGGQNTIRIRIRRNAENAKYFYEALTRTESESCTCLEKKDRHRTRIG